MDDLGTIKEAIPINTYYVHTYYMNFTFQQPTTVLGNSLIALARTIMYSTLESKAQHTPWLLIGQDSTATSQV
jgi:hypothetical protein